MFKVNAINYFGDTEKYEWKTLEQLLSDYENADILALPNDFDKVTCASIDGKELTVSTFGDFIDAVAEYAGIEITHAE